MGNFSYLLYMFRHANVNTSKLTKASFDYLFCDYRTTLLETQGATVPLWKLFLMIDDSKIFGYYGPEACNAFSNLNNAIEDISTDFSSVSLDPKNMALSGTANNGDPIPICICTKPDRYRIPCAEALFNSIKSNPRLFQDDAKFFWDLTGVTVFMEQDGGYLCYINFPGPGGGQTRYGSWQHNVAKFKRPQFLEQKQILLRTLPLIQNSLSLEQCDDISYYRMLHEEYVESKTYEETEPEEEEEEPASPSVGEKRKATAAQMRENKKLEEKKRLADLKHAFDSVFQEFCKLVPETIPFVIELPTGRIEFPLPVYNHEICEIMIDVANEDDVDYEILKYLARIYLMLSPSQIPWDVRSTFEMLNAVYGPLLSLGSALWK